MWSPHGHIVLNMKEMDNMRGIKKSWTREMLENSQHGFLAKASWAVFNCSMILLLLEMLGGGSGQVFSMEMEKPPPELNPHLSAIARLAKPSPMIRIPEGEFLMGTVRRDHEQFSLETQYDDTEFPQQLIWLDLYEIDRDEVSLGEYLAFLQAQHRPVSNPLRYLIWHLIDVHFLPDYVMTRWPALFVTWEEAESFCRAQGKRLPTEAEWEKAARGTGGQLFPWGRENPNSDLAVFKLYHVHQIPLVAAVDSWESGESPFGLRHMSGNVKEWVGDWFGPDYYSIMPKRNPQGPETGRYKGVRGGSWRSKSHLLRTATRNGAPPEKRSPTIGFRCAKSE